MQKTKKKTKKNKPLNPNISGIYIYEPGLKAYYSTKRTKSTKHKNVYHIRRGFHKETLWINHTDYSNIESDYTITNDCYSFTYNNTEYLIPVKPQYVDGLGYYVKIFKA